MESENIPQKTEALSEGKAEGKAVPHDRRPHPESARDANREQASDTIEEHSTVTIPEEITKIS